MSRKEVNISSLEELVSFVLKNKHEAKERYSLEDDGKYDYQTKKTVITRYYLYRSSGFVYSTFIEIPIELGEMIDSIWTKKPYYQGSKDLRRYGSLSLLGILKRLGKGEDTAKQLKAAEAKQKAQLEKNARNAQRRNIREEYQKLYKLLLDNPNLISLDKVFTLEAASNIAHMEDET